MSNLINRLLVVYGQPESTDPNAFLDEIENAVKRFDDHVQDRAADIILRTHKRAFFPSPAVIIQACEEIDALKVKAPRDAIKYPDWTPAAVSRADRLIVSDVGRLAADEGWALGLHDFCRKHGRLPNSSEQHQIKIDSRDFDRAYCAVIDMEANSLSSSLKKLGEAMLERRNKYAAMSYGEFSKC